MDVVFIIIYVSLGFVVAFVLIKTGDSNRRARRNETMLENIHEHILSGKKLPTGETRLNKLIRTDCMDKREEE